MHEGKGNCVKCLKMGWNRKEGRGNKDLKKGGNLGHGVGALKRGLEPPYKLCVLKGIIIAPHHMPTWHVTFHASIASEFCSKACDCHTPLFFICQSLLKIENFLNI